MRPLVWTSNTALQWIRFVMLTQKTGASSGMKLLFVRRIMCDRFSTTSIDYVPLPRLSGKIMKDPMLALGPYTISRHIPVQE